MGSASITKAKRLGFFIVDTNVGLELLRTTPKRTFAEAALRFAALLEGDGEALTDGRALDRLMAEVVRLERGA